MTPIAIKIEETTQLYQLTKGNTINEAKVDTNMGVKHLKKKTADTINKYLKNDERSPIQIFTDGIKSQNGVGAGIALFESSNHIKTSTAC